MPKRLAGFLAAVLCHAAADADPVLRSNDIEYAHVDGRALALDLYRPESADAAPLVVWIHGGAWERGSKDDMPLEALVDHRFAIASLDFRPASAARFPGQVHDIKAAIRFLRAAAARYGYDATRIGILGASSGAHLAALVGTTNGDAALEGALGEHRDASSTVHAIVSYFGATNLTTILSQSTPFGLGVREPALRRLLGALPDDTVELARLASPVFHVGPTDPPLLLLHGDQDPQMPINQAHELHGAYAKVGLDVQFQVIHGAAHGGNIFYSPPYLDVAMAFLRRTIAR